MSKLSNHSAPIIIGLCASIIGIFVWITGLPNLESAISHFTHTQAERINQSTFSDGVYTNMYFGFSLVLPSSWIVSDKAQRDTILAKGRRTYSRDPNTQRLYDDVIESSSCILFCSKLATGTKTGFNSSIMIVTEDIRNSPGIINGKEFLYHLTNKLDKNDYQFEHDAEEIYTANIDGRDIYYNKTQMDFSQIVVKQQSFVTIINRYAIIFNLTYIDDNDLPILLNSIKSLKFTSSTN